MRKVAIGGALKKAEKAAIIHSQTHKNANKNAPKTGKFAKNPFVHSIKFSLNLQFISCYQSKSLHLKSQRLRMYQQN